MVEGAPLLREYTGDGIEGSNPFLSAISAILASFETCRIIRFPPELCTNKREFAGEYRGNATATQ